VNLLPCRDLLFVIRMVLCIAVGTLYSCNGVKKEAREGTEQPAAAEPALTEKSTPDPLPEYMEKGKELYGQHCLVCHQATGGGVTGLNPPLKQTEYVVGDKERLISIIINGSNKGLEVNGMTYSNAMPGFPGLSNEDIAYVTSYIRNSFGNAAASVTASEVEAVRKKG